MGKKLRKMGIKTTYLERKKVKKQYEYNRYI